MLATATLYLGCLDSTGVGYENALRAAMLDDMTRFLAAQDAFHSAYGDYAGSIGSSETPGTGGAGVVVFVPSREKAVTLTYVSDSSWGATIVTWDTPGPGTSSVCGIYQGSRPDPYFPATMSPRTAACW